MDFQYTHVVLNNTKYGNIYYVASKRGSVFKHENINELRF